MKVTAIIPAFNEAKRLSSVLEALSGYVDEMIVVDDGSSDETTKTATHHPGVLAIRHRVNLGKGAALKTGCEFAVERNADVIVCLDADGQHLPSEIPQLTAPLRDGLAKIVFGVRKMQSNQSMPMVAKIGNRALSLMTRLLFRIQVSDTQCGFRAFTRAAYQAIKW